MENLDPDELSVEELFQLQRRLAESMDIKEQLRALWIGSMLKERCDMCSDEKLGGLLTMVQEEMNIYGPEYAVCELARRRLQKRNSPRR